jgi:hypothetical protein
MITTDFNKYDESLYITETEFAGNKIKLKTALNADDVLTIARKCVEIYDNGIDFASDEISGFGKNVISMENAFNVLLIGACTDIGDDYDYNQVISCGLVDFLKENVTNAQETLDKIYYIIDKRDSIPYVLERALVELVSKIPDSKEIMKIYSKLKKDMTSEKFEGIVEKIKDVMSIDSKRAK